MLPVHSISVDGEKSTGPYEKFYSLLPDYVCGLIWTLDIVWIVALRVSTPELYRIADAVARLLAPFRVPEFAVGFLLIVTGVMLPFAVARALNPIMITLLNADVNRWFKKTPNTEVTPDQLGLATKRLADVVGATPPVTGWARVFMQYLRHIGSPTVPTLANAYREITERVFLACPVSLLVGLLIFSAFGQGVFAGSAGSVAAVLTVLAAVHRSRNALRDWNTNVLFAFLVATNSAQRHRPPVASGSAETAG